MTDLEIEPKTFQMVGKRMLNIENQEVYSKKAQGRWEALSWALGLEDRTPPWKGNE